MKIKNVIKKVAKQHGVSCEQVRNDIKEAIRIGMASKDPIAKENWRKISKNGREPTVEEVIAFLALEVEANL